MGFSQTQISFASRILKRNKNVFKLLSGKAKRVEKHVIKNLRSHFRAINLHLENASKKIS